MAGTENLIDIEPSPVAINSSAATAKDAYSVIEGSEVPAPKVKPPPHHGHHGHADIHVVSVHPGEAAAGGVSGTGAVPKSAAAVFSYQNQTAQDIESGRARFDSVGSYSSGGSEDALLPAASSRSGGGGGLNSSPRRGGGGGGVRRENRPLLGSARSDRSHGGAGSTSGYDEIYEHCNTFPGKRGYGFHQCLIDLPSAAASFHFLVCDELLLVLAN